MILQIHLIMQWKPDITILVNDRLRNLLTAYGNTPLPIKRTSEQSQVPITGLHLLHILFGNRFHFRNTVAIHVSINICKSN